MYNLNKNLIKKMKKYKIYKFKDQRALHKEIKSHLKSLINLNINYSHRVQYKNKVKNQNKFKIRAGIFN